MPSDGATSLGYPTPAHFLNRWTAQRKADAVAQNLAGPLLRRSAFTKKIPTVSLRKLLFNSSVRSGNIPALFADLAEEYGPVFKIRPPLSKPMLFLAGTETNYWVHRHGRMPTFDTLPLHEARAYSATGQRVALLQEYMSTSSA